METLIAFLIGAFSGVLIASLTVFAAFKMAEKEIEKKRRVRTVNNNKHYEIYIKKSRQN